MRFFPVANRFQAGHRIRLDVSSSNFPIVDVNPQTGKNPTETRDWRVARNTLLMGPGQASHVELPLLPVSSLG